MGSLLSRWRKSPSTKDLLTSLQSEMSELQSVNSLTQQRQRRFLGYLTAYFIVLYLIFALIVYLKYFRHPDYADFLSQARLATPFLVSPLILLLLQRLLSWWYRRQLLRNDVRLKELRAKKLKLLNEVMEKETYKVAKDILEKFAPEQLQRPSLLSSTTAIVSPVSLSASTSDLRRRRHESENEDRRLKQSSGGGDDRLGGRSSSIVGSNANRPWLRTTTSNGSNSGGVASTNLQRSASGSMPALNVNPDLPISSRNAARKRQWLMQQEVPSSGLTPTVSRPMRQPLPAPEGRQQLALTNRMASNAVALPQGQSTPMGPPLPRPILPRDRGYMDRLVEYLVGDGPSNRYALICKQCQSHNGMALKEEFEFIAYRCCYCHYWNPARKQKPLAPRLQFNDVSHQQSSSDSEDEKSKMTPSKFIQESNSPSKGIDHTEEPTKEEIEFDAESNSDGGAESYSEDVVGTKEAGDEGSSQLFTSVLDADDENNTDKDK